MWEDFKGKPLRKGKPSLSPRFLRENEGKSEGLHDVFAKPIRTDRLCKITGKDNWHLAISSRLKKRSSGWSKQGRSKRAT